MTSHFFSALFARRNAVRGEAAALFALFLGMLSSVSAQTIGTCAGGKKGRREYTFATNNSSVPFYPKLCAFLVLQVFLSFAQAATPAPLPNPNLSLLTNGIVYAVTVMPDGSVVFGGGFSSVNGTSRSNIAKLKPDGTLDPDWNPGTNDIVSALAHDGNGNVYAGGSFTSVGGVSRNYIAKLLSSGNGVVDGSWNPSPNSSVQAIALDSGGNVYVGGYFTNISSQLRNHIAKLSGVNGAADASWNPSASSDVLAIALDSGGDVYAGGDFTNIGGQSRNRIAKLSGAGTGAADVSWNPSANRGVLAIALDSGGNVYAGGQFTSIGGQSRNYIAKLSGTGTGVADATWNPSASAAGFCGEGSSRVVRAIAVDANGNVYAGGQFASIGGQSRYLVAKLSGTGTGAADLSWTPSVNGNEFSSVWALAVSSNTVYLGGNFTSISGQSRWGFATLTGASATVGSAVNAEVPGSVSAVVAQPGGGTLVGGYFSQANGQSRGNILRLQADGTIDPNWNPSADGTVSALSMDSTGNVYAGGGFRNIGGQAHNCVAKLSGSGTGGAAANWSPSVSGVSVALAIDSNGNVYAGTDNYSLVKLSGTTGAVDSNWNPSPDNWVRALAIDGSGNVYAGGDFANIGGQSRSSIAKLSGTTGAADPAWDPSASGTTNSQIGTTVAALALDTSGNVYAGGNFTSIGGQSRSSIAKLSGTSGAADPTWDPSVSVSGGTSYTAPITALDLDAGGNVYAGGIFTSIGGQPRNNIAKLSGTSTGLADINWNPSANDAVSAFAIDASGNVYAGGFFTSIGGQSRNGIALLPMANSSVTGTTPGGTLVNAAFSGGGSACAFANAQFIDVSAVPTAPPAGTSFPQGLFDFTTTTCTTGGTITLTLTYAQPLPAGSVYMKYGPTADNATPHWYQYPATISGNTAIIQITDGGAGDSDLVANGSMSDPGGPALPAVTAPTLTSVVARATHGHTGTFDLPINIAAAVDSNTITVEPRGPEQGNLRHLIFTFSGPVTSVSGVQLAGTATSTLSTGTAGTATFDSNNVIVPLTGVPDRKRLQVTLTDINGVAGANASVALAFLLGDVTQDRQVTGLDGAITGAKSPSALTSSNFLYNVTLSGSINALDKAVVSANSPKAAE